MSDFESAFSATIALGGAIGVAIWAVRYLWTIFHAILGGPTWKE